MTAIFQQQCPACDVMLDFEVTYHEAGRNDDGDATFTVHAQTTPASTEHVWTHKPQDEEKVAALDLSPDCRDGNHSKCDGVAWDLELDAPTACECDCQCNGKAAGL